MLRFGEPPYLECSSKGDKRFSAFYARIKARDNKSIEDIYQAYKVFSDGATGLDWRAAKGRKDCINMATCRLLYSMLWREYIAENPELNFILNKASGLSDVFGQLGHACQAEELWRIRRSYSE
jgi:hypothetical protein